MAQATWERGIDTGDTGVDARRMASPLLVTFAPVEPRAGSQPTLTAAVAWALPGFLIGTVFWHFVGFWGFVSHVVLGEVPAEPAGPTPLVAIVRTSEPPASAAALSANACVALALDRATGTTRSKACDGRPIASPPAQPAGKEDLAALRKSTTSAPALVTRGDAAGHSQSGAP